MTGWRACTKHELCLAHLCTGLATGLHLRFNGMMTVYKFSQTCGVPCCFLSISVTGLTLESTGRAGMSAEGITEMAEDLVEDLEAMGRLPEAAILARDYLKDDERAVVLLTQVWCSTSVAWVLLTPLHTRLWIFNRAACLPTG